MFHVPRGRWRSSAVVVAGAMSVQEVGVGHKIPERSRRPGGINSELSSWVLVGSSAAAWLGSRLLLSAGSVSGDTASRHRKPAKAGACVDLAWPVTQETAEVAQRTVMSTQVAMYQPRDHST